MQTPQEMSAFFTKVGLVLLNYHNNCYHFLEKRLAYEEWYLPVTLALDYVIPKFNLGATYENYAWQVPIQVQLSSGLAVIEYCKQQKITKLGVD